MLLKPGVGPSQGGAVDAGVGDVEGTVGVCDVRGSQRSPRIENRLPGPVDSISVLV